jgi:hypothetical protein
LLWPQSKTEWIIADERLANMLAARSLFQWLGAI